MIPITILIQLDRCTSHCSVAEEGETVNCRRWHQPKGGDTALLGLRMPSRIVLHVAEKNSVAKGVAGILAQPNHPRAVSKMAN